VCKPGHTEQRLWGAPQWDSGRITSNASTHVSYGGPALSPATRYQWQVRWWNDAGEASSWSNPALFTTGLFRAADWKGALMLKAPVITLLCLLQ